MPLAVGLKPSGVNDRDLPQKRNTESILWRHYSIKFTREVDFMTVPLDLFSFSLDLRHLICLLFVLTFESDKLCHRSSFCKNIIIVGYNLDM